MSATTGARQRLTFPAVEPPRGGSLDELVAHFDARPQEGTDLIDGIYDASFTAILGEPSIGKSRFKRQSIAALLTATAFLDHAPRAGDHRVIVYNTDPGTVQRETHAFKALIPHEHWADLYVRSPHPATEARAWKDEVSLCQDQGVTVVFFDNLFGGLSGTQDVNDSAAILPLLDRLTDFANEGIAVVAVCHTNASKTARIIGSTAAEARARAKVHITGSGVSRTVTVSGNDMVPSQFTLRTTEHGVELCSAGCEPRPGKRVALAESVKDAVAEATSWDDAVQRMLDSATHKNSESAKKYLVRAVRRDASIWPDRPSDR